jgi:hypothetical protein
MYIQLTKKKTYTFVIFLAGLTVLLWLTLVAIKDLPAEYLRLKGMIAIAQMPFKSVKYGLDYTSQTSPGGFLGSVANLFGPAKLDVEVGTSTMARDVPVLLYHGITETPDRFSMTAETFADQMFALKRAGYHTITLQEFQDFLDGEKRLNEKSFLLTFDDARIDAYWGADPVLQALDFTAVMFVATADSINARPLPSYYIHHSLLARMIRTGRWEIGSHAIQQYGGFIPVDRFGNEANFLSNKMWFGEHDRLETDEEYRARITHELVDSKKELEERFGVPIAAFAYPFGDYGQQTSNHPGAQAVIEEIVRTTYPIAFNQVWPTDALFNSNYPDIDRAHVRRIEPSTRWTGEQVLALVENSRTKNIAFKDDFRVDQGWKHNWGSGSLENNRLELAAGTTTTGAIAFLDGTHEWDDYAYTASAVRISGDFISLVSRFQNNNNYVSCWFSDREVKIMEKVGGVERTLAKVRNTLESGDTGATLGMSVSGQTARCLEGQQVVASVSGIHRELSKGGIGFIAWDRVPNTAALSVLSVSVAPTQDAVALSAPALDGNSPDQ